MGRMRCIVKGCYSNHGSDPKPQSNKSAKQDEHIRSFGFPNKARDPIMRKLWIKAIPMLREDLVNKRSKPVICIKHWPEGFKFKIGKGGFVRPVHPPSIFPELTKAEMVILPSMVSKKKRKSSKTVDKAGKVRKPSAPTFTGAPAMKLHSFELKDSLKRKMGTPFYSNHNNNHNWQDLPAIKIPKLADLIPAARFKQDLPTTSSSNPRLPTTTNSNLIQACFQRDLSASSSSNTRFPTTNSRAPNNTLSILSNLVSRFPSATTSMSATSLSESTDLSLLTMVEMSNDKPRKTLFIPCSKRQHLQFQTVAEKTSMMPHNEMNRVIPNRTPDTDSATIETYKKKLEDFQQQIDLQRKSWPDNHGNRRSNAELIKEFSNRLSTEYGKKFRPILPKGGHQDQNLESILKAYWKWACATCISKGKSVTSTSSTKQVLVIDDNDGSVGSSTDTKDELPTPQSSDDTMIAVNSITTVSSMEVMPIVSAPRRAVDPTPSASLQSTKVATPPIISVKPSNFVYHPSGLTYAPLPPGSSAVTLPPGHHPVSMPQPQFIPVNYMLPNGVPAAHQPPHGVPVQASRGVTPMIQPPPAHVVGTAPIPNQPTAAVAPQTQSVMGKGVRNDLSHILNPKVPLPDVRSSIRDDVLRALPTDVADWTVQNVAYYFKAHGYIHESKLLEEQEIDGRAMLLMSRNDCLTGLRIKLGPALKIYHMHIHKLQKKTDFLG